MANNLSFSNSRFPQHAPDLLIPILIVAPILLIGLMLIPSILLILLHILFLILIPMIYSRFPNLLITILIIQMAGMIAYDFSLPPFS